jgi:glutaryl-CoA transferase
MANRPVLIPILAERLAVRPAREWMQALEAVGVASGPINDFAQVFADPQVQHRQVLRQIAHPTAGSIGMIANPVRFSETPIEYARHPPLHAEHTREILAELLELPAEEIGSLRQTGVVR